MSVKGHEYAQQDKAVNIVVYDKALDAVEAEYHLDLKGGIEIGEALAGR